MEGGDATMKVIEEYATNKMKFKEIFNEGKIENDLLKYIPIKQESSENVKTKKINDKKNWNLLCYKRKDGYLVCAQCESKIGCNNICGDCFCQHCLEFNDDCKC